MVLKMRTSTRALIAGVALMCCLPATPCAQCVIFDQPDELFARNDVVFRGTVVAKEATGIRGDHVIVEVATFRVEQSWKGKPEREVRVGSLKNRQLASPPLQPTSR